jgi:hypothetical protein
LIDDHGRGRPASVARATDPIIAEIRGRKIGDTFFDRPSFLPTFFRGSPRYLSLVFPLM